MAYCSTPLFRPAFAILITSALACSSSDGAGDAEGESSSASASSSGSGEAGSAGESGSEASSSATDASSTDGSGENSTDGGSGMETDSTTGDSCEDFDDAFGGPLDITITNNSNVVQYVQLADECNQQVIRRLNQNGAPVAGNDDCWTCEAMLLEGCLCPPMPGPPCFASAGMKIDPGGSYIATIGTTGYVADQVPDTCISGDCLTTCNRAIALPAGTYQAQITVSDQVTCDGGGCDCNSDADGWCFVEADGSLSGTPQTLDTDVVLPTGAVTISID